MKKSVTELSEKEIGGILKQIYKASPNPSNLTMVVDDTAEGRELIACLRRHYWQGLEAEIERVCKPEKPRRGYTTCGLGNWIANAVKTP